MKTIGDLVKNENIDCDFTVTTVTDVCLYESGATAQKENLDNLVAAGVAGSDDVIYSENEAAEKVPPTSYIAIIHYTDFTTVIRDQRSERLLKSRSRASVSI